jgi:hypothetical protein
MVTAAFDLPSLPQSYEPEGWMGGFYVYADDSGKHQNPKNPFISFCGYVATSSEVARFSEEWLKCRHIWQVPPIHMSPIMYPDRDEAWQKVRDSWGDDWEAKREAMLLELAGIVCRGSMLCVGAVVDAEHYRSMRESKFTQQFNPLNLAFQRVVMRTIETTELVDKHTPIGVVIDDSREGYLHCYDMLDRLKQAFPRVRERIGSLCFVDDEAFPMVQAADMIAFESRQFMEARVKDPAVKSSELFIRLTRWKMHQPKFITGDMLDKWDRDMSAMDGELTGEGN